MENKGNINQIFISNVVFWCKKLDLSFAELANRSGIDEGKINAIMEGNQEDISLTNLRDIAQAIGVNPEVLLK